MPETKPHNDQPIPEKDTQIFDLNTDDTAEAMAVCGDIIRKGGTVVFPTETVYGLGANALDPAAVEQIYAAKGRPGDNPLIVHIYDLAQLDDLVEAVPEKAKRLAGAFWPGPLTMIMKRSDRIPDTVTAGLDTVGIRYPSHPMANAFLKAADRPVAAPSANISGRPSPTKGEHVLEDMLGKVDAILVGDESDVGLESTVIDMTTTPPTVYRPGGVTVDDIRRVIGDVKVHAVPLSHDAADPVGYTFENGGRKLAIMTDTGWKKALPMPSFKSTARSARSSSWPTPSSSCGTTAGFPGTTSNGPIPSRSRTAPRTMILTAGILWCGSIPVYSMCSSNGRGGSRSKNPGCPWRSS